jgi:uncharacterized protein YjbI with pentapeptide repeats
MSGALIPQAKLQDVTFAECKLDGTNFRMSEADRILFDHVNLRRTEFSAEPGGLYCPVSGVECACCAALFMAKTEVPLNPSSG